MVCDSLNDTLKYNTQKFSYSYEKGLYSSTELQNIRLYATVEGDLEKIDLLSIEVNKPSSGPEFLIVDLNFNIIRIGTNFKNIPEDYSLVFRDNFEFNGSLYEQSWFCENLNNVGDLTTFLVYSPSVGVLRLVDYSNGSIYYRCFVCE